MQQKQQEKHEEFLSISSQPNVTTSSPYLQTVENKIKNLKFDYVIIH
jgi:hypothetical protein